MPKLCIMNIWIICKINSTACRLWPRILKQFFNLKSVEFWFFVPLTKRRIISQFPMLEKTKTTVWSPKKIFLLRLQTNFFNKGLQLTCLLHLISRWSYQPYLHCPYWPQEMFTFIKTLTWKKTKKKYTMISLEIWQFKEALMWFLK